MGRFGEKHEFHLFFWHLPLLLNMMMTQLTGESDGRGRVDIMPSLQRIWVEISFILFLMDIVIVIESNYHDGFCEVSA